MGGSNQKPPLVDVWTFSGIAHLREKKIVKSFVTVNVYDY